MSKSCRDAFLISTLMTLFVLPGLAAPNSGGLTEATAKDLIEHQTQVGGCGEPVFDFTSVQIASPADQKEDGRKYRLYPVHARFFVTCRVADEQMRAEVDLRTEYYRDEFGKWRSSDPGFEGDQSWDNTQNGVRCRAQNLAHLTVDGNGKVTGSTPAKDQRLGFPACRLVPKAAD
jgi:hypothetical protein